MTTPGQRDLAALSARLEYGGDSPRYRRMQLLEAAWKGMRYQLEGRPSWWDQDVPLRERAPCVVIPLARTAGRRLVAMLFGESRFPTASIVAAEDAQPAQEATAVALTAYISSLVAAAKLRVAMSEYATQGLSTGSACAVLALVNGRPSIKMIPARHAHPTLDAEGAVTRLEILYKTGEGDDLRWYRRVIDEERDVVYEPAPVSDDGTPPVWIEASSVETFGCVPVVWTRNDADPTDEGVDGCAIHEDLLDELEALDFAASQRHRNGLYNGEPFIVRTLGENDEDSGSGMSAARGRTADAQRFSWTSSVAGAANRLAGWITGTQSAAQKAPGRIVTLSRGGDMRLVESTGAGAAILQGNADDLRRRILEDLSVVMADPSEVSANASAALQKQLYAPMTARVDDLREVYGQALVQVLGKLLHMSALAAARGELVRVRGFVAARDVLLEELSLGWEDQEIELRWGDYFAPTWQDIGSAIDSAQRACGGAAVLSRATAVRIIAPVVGVANADEELAAIAEDEASGATAAKGILGALGGEP
jgi:hypothetical protein